MLSRTGKEKHKMKPEWIEYTGSDEQIEEIQKSEHGWMTEDFIVIDGSAPIHDLLCIGDKYLICDPHPYANEIKKDGTIHKDCHYAIDLTGECQAPFEGWFIPTSIGFAEIDKPIKWRPKCPPDPED